MGTGFAKTSCTRTSFKSSQGPSIIAHLNSEFAKVFFVYSEVTSKCPGSFLSVPVVVWVVLVVVLAVLGMVLQLVEVVACHC